MFTKNLSYYFNEIFKAEFIELVEEIELLKENEKIVQINEIERILNQCQYKIYSYFRGYMQKIPLILNNYSYISDEILKNCIIRDITKKSRVFTDLCGNKFFSINRERFIYLNKHFYKINENYTPNNINDLLNSEIFLNKYLKNIKITSETDSIINIFCMIYSNISIYNTDFMKIKRNILDYFKNFESHNHNLWCTLNLFSLSNWDKSESEILKYASKAKETSITCPLSYIALCNYYLLVKKDIIKATHYYTVAKRLSQLNINAPKSFETNSKLIYIEFFICIEFIKIGDLEKAKNHYLLFRNNPFFNRIFPFFEEVVFEEIVKDIDNISNFMATQLKEMYKNIFDEKKKYPFFDLIDNILIEFRGQLLQDFKGIGVVNFKNIRTCLVQFINDLPYWNLFKEEFNPEYHYLKKIINKHANEIFKIFQESNLI